MFTFHKSNSQDIEKYFHHTYVKFKETGDRIFKICGVTKDYVRAEDSSGFDIHIDLNEPYHVDFVIPSRKVFQVDKTAYILYRKPHRQYYRGMHQENTGFDMLNADGDWKPCKFDFQMIESFINKADYQKAEDIENFESIALNTQMALAKCGHVYFGLNRIGMLDTKRGFGAFRPIYEQEVKHQFKHLSMQWGPM